MTRIINHMELSAAEPQPNAYEEGRNFGQDEQDCSAPDAAPAAFGSASCSSYLKFSELGGIAITSKTYGLRNLCQPFEKKSAACGTFQSLRCKERREGMGLWASEGE